jgi:hypothetical protein
VGKVLYQFQSRSQRQSGQSDAPNDEELDITAAKRQITGRPVPNVQSDTSGMDYLLWPILQVSPLPNVREPESHSSEVGNEEIQEGAEACQKGDALARTDSPSETRDV